MIVKIWQTDRNRNPYATNYPDYEGFVEIEDSKIRVVGWIRSGPTGQHIHLTDKSGN